MFLITFSLSSSSTFHLSSKKLPPMAPSNSLANAIASIPFNRIELRQAYADAGVETIFARSHFCQLRGNFHCVPIK